MPEATRIESGSTTVATPGTAVQLVPPSKSPNSQSGIIRVMLSPDSGNTEPVVVGDKTVKAAAKSQNGIVLIKTAGPVTVAVTDITSLWVDAGTAGDKLAWVAFYQ